MNENLFLLSALGAIPTLGSGLFMFLQWWFSRRDRLRADGRTQEQVDRADFDRQRKDLTSDQREWVDRMAIELERRDKDIEALRRNRDYWYDKARAWYGIAHDVWRDCRTMRHDYAGERTWIINVLAREHPEIVLPTLEPVPDRPNIPMGLEDPKDDSL